MKQSFVIIFGLAAMATAGPALGIIGSVVGGVMGGGRKGKRDLELENALLVVRDRTLQEWERVMHNPSKISPQMREALQHRGYKAPAQVKNAYAPSAGDSQGSDSIGKQQALKSIQAGDAIPPSVLEHMKSAGWSGPGLARRELGEDLEARDFDQEILELFVRGLEYDGFEEYEY